MDYPVDVQVDYGSGERSRGLAVLGILYYLKYLLLIPHAIALIFVGIVTFVAVWIGYWAILFTGRQPAGIDRFASGAIRWTTRTSAWFFATTDKYPDFGFEDGAGDAQTTAQSEDGSRNRLLAIAGIIGLKFVILLPHLIVLWILGVVTTIVGWIGFWVILFTGKLPEGIHTLEVSYLRWTARVGGWIASLTDKYPPFAME